MVDIFFFYSRSLHGLNTVSVASALHGPITALITVGLFCSYSRSLFDGPNAALRVPNTFTVA
jgi:hypothetical protein